ncbi:hypothetical protein ACHAXR_004833, partial [Thalassiosira sp. AJA248-18]
MAGKRGGKVQVGARRKTNVRHDGNRKGRDPDERGGREERRREKTTFRPSGFGVGDGGAKGGRKMPSAKRIPPTDDDPRGNYSMHRPDPNSRARRVRPIPSGEFSDVEHGLLPTSYSYSSDESDHCDAYHQDRREGPIKRDWEEEDHRRQTEIMQQQQHQRQHHQRQQQHQQYNHSQNDQQLNHNDHAFTQFNIQPLEEEYSESEEEEGPSDEEEENEGAPLFFSPSGNFNSATDGYSEQHAKGAGWGVDYLLERAKKKEKERKQKKQAFEIEERRRRKEERSGELWWWQDNDEWDDVDFDDYHKRSFKCSIQALLFTMAFAAAIAFVVRGKLGSATQQHDADNGELAHSDFHGATPSSRWGHRFDDDDAAPEGEEDYYINESDGKRIPKYHHHSHKNHSKSLTPEEKAAEEGNWEDYEMLVADVLSNASPEWDINSKVGETSDNDEDDGNDSDGYTDHWVRYFDKSSQAYYYFHQETNVTTWVKPVMERGVAILGITYGTGKEYVIEEGGTIDESYSDTHIDPVGESSTDAAQVAVAANDASFSKEDVPMSSIDSRLTEVLDRYKDTYWRWNHPYRLPESAQWGGIDTPVFWRVPLSGATTVEEMFTQCYHMIVAGTTGRSKDGMAVLSHNISEHLSVVTLEDGAHYLNIDMSTLEGIQAAKKAGLGRSGVADVILTRYLGHTAELFRDTGHTGRCFTILRHPVDRAVAVFHSLKRNGAKAVSNMSIMEYASSNIVEDNWMTRILTDTMEGDLTHHHLQVAKEVIGRKCLVGFFVSMISNTIVSMIQVDKIEESMKQFTKFFRWEEIKSVNKHHSVVGSVQSKEKDLAGKRACFDKFVKQGVNRHEYSKVPTTNDVWKKLKEKNELDIELYQYAEA